MNYKSNHFTLLWFKICSLISKKISFSNENAPSPRSIYLVLVLHMLNNILIRYAKKRTRDFARKNVTKPTIVLTAFFRQNNLVLTGWRVKFQENVWTFVYYTLYIYYIIYTNVLYMILYMINEYNYSIANI